MRQSCNKIAGFIFVVCIIAASAVSLRAAESETSIIANALMSSEIQEQLRQFKDLIDHAAVKVEIFNDLDVITLDGPILRGGDMACGHATLTIQRTFQRSWNGMGMQARYSADLQSVNRCKELGS